MAIWDNLIKRVVAPYVDEGIKKYKEGQLVKGLELYSSRANRVPVSSGVESAEGSVSRIYGSGVSHSTLREFASYYPVLRSCVNYRKRVLSRLKWGISTMEVMTDKKKKEQYYKDAEKVKEFFRFPSGDKTVSFNNFVSKIVEDLVVLDAVAIYKRKNRRGGFYGYLNVDSSTIELILNEDGTTPTPPDPAYQQKVDGEVKEKLTLDELY